MSHFTVIVIGDNVDGQLEPYNENLEVKPYRQKVDFQDLKRMVEHYQDHKEHGNSEIIKAIKEEYGTDHYPIIINEEEIVSPSFNVMKVLYKKWAGRELYHDKRGYYHYSTYNPDSKWDWYSIGGRWMGYFKVKAGARVAVLGEPGVFGNTPEEGCADQLLKGDIDFETMRNEAADAADRQYASYTKATKGLPKHTPWSHFVTKIEEQVKRQENGEITSEEFQKERDLIRNEYQSQPAIKALNKTKEFGFMFDFDEFLVPRKTYIARAMAGAISPYAFVKDGKWHQKGQMGWFGMRSNEMSQDQWNKIVNDMLDALPDEEMVTLVDCHI